MAQGDVQEQLFLFDLGVDVAQLRAEARSLIVAGGRAPNTEKTYAADWKQFEAWCRTAGRAPLPATEDTVCLYLAHVARRLKVGSVEHHASAIRRYHLVGGHPSPVGDDAKAVLAGLRRRRGSESEPKAAITPADLRAISGVLDRRTANGARDAALLMLGFSTGLRRADLVAIDLDDLRVLKQGIVVRVGRRQREKNDQAGKGREIAVFPGTRRETCPVRAVESWLRHRGRQPGPLFVRLAGRGAGVGRLSAFMVSVIVKNSVEAIGVDPRPYGGHSLRAGMITACAAAGASDSSIMLRSGHKTPGMIRGYRRHADLFYSNPLAKAL